MAQLSKLKSSKDFLKYLSSIEKTDNVITKFTCLDTKQLPFLLHKWDRVDAQTITCNTPDNETQAILAHWKPLPLILVKSTMVQSTGTDNIGRD